MSGYLKLCIVAVLLLAGTSTAQGQGYGTYPGGSGYGNMRGPSLEPGLSQSRQMQRENELRWQQSEQERLRLQRENARRQQQYNDSIYGRRRY